ncbi:hypothetical protein T10_8152 [Trichinella papuae]|uniref:Uncharacterized protein n=1 Tax=Trichinella papuae TaxID=268474 RepID=A0A0V1M933_9BILA|nr:hypothetical protein T10_8152 [Trichinella papuae]
MNKKYFSHKRLQIFGNQKKSFSFHSMRQNQHEKLVIHCQIPGPRCSRDFTTIVCFNGTSELSV